MRGPRHIRPGDAGSRRRAQHGRTARGRVYNPSRLQAHRGPRPRRRACHLGAHLAARRRIRHRRQRDPERAQRRIRDGGRPLRQGRRGHRRPRQRRVERGRARRDNSQTPDRPAQSRRVLYLRVKSPVSIDEAPGQRAWDSRPGRHGAGDGLRARPLLRVRAHVRGRRQEGASPRVHRRARVRSPGGGRMVDMNVKIGGVTLKNPIMPASGCFSTDLAQVIDLNRLGALVAKTVSRAFRAGHPPPRVSEVEGGMINSIGLPTKGIGYFLEHQVPDYKRFTPPLVGSISATTIEDFEAMARDVSTSAIDVLEVNISCPTRDPKGGNFALHEEHTFNVMRRIRQTTDKPIWCKLSPNAGDVVAIAKSAELAGADALVVSNTILGLKIDINTFRPAIGNKFGGLSGPGIKPIIVRMVYQCAKAVKIPIIGCGGIVKLEDVIEYMLAGASAVMIGYLIFRNPSGIIAIIDGLQEWCAKRGFARVADLTGAMIDEAPRETYAAAAAPIG